MRNIIVALALIGSLAFADSKTSIAVSDLEARGMTKDEGGIISDRLREELLNTGVFRVMERSVMDQILKEQSFQQTGVCSGSDCQVQVGRMLGVDRMVIGSVGKLGTLYTLSVRMLNVETGEIEQSFSQDHQGVIEDLVRGPIRSVAAKLAWAISSKKNPQAAPAPETSLTATTPVASVPQSIQGVEPAVATKAPTVEPTPQPQAKPVSTVQPLEIGIRLHLGAASLSGSKALKNLFGENDGYWQFGGEVRVNMGSVSLMTHVLLTEINLAAEEDLSTESYDSEYKAKTQLRYLSVPILIGFNFSPHFQVFAGPALDFHLSNEVKSSVTMNGATIADTTYKGVDGFMNFYPSLIAGAGLRFGGFLVDFHYQWALGDAYKESREEILGEDQREYYIKFSKWALSFGYLF